MKNWKYEQKIGLAILWNFQIINTIKFHCCLRLSLAQLHIFCESFNIFGAKFFFFIDKKATLASRMNECNTTLLFFIFILCSIDLITRIKLCSAFMAHTSNRNATLWFHVAINHIIAVQVNYMHSRLTFHSLCGWRLMWFDISLSKHKAYQ